MSQFLELAEPVKDNGVAEVEVGGRWVHPEFDPQRLARGQARSQVGFHLDVDSPAQRVFPARHERQW